MDKTQVADDGEVEGVDVEPTATAPDGGVSDADASKTPAQPAVDVDKLKADYEEKLARANQDLNQTKSVLQKQQAQQEKLYKEKQDELQRQLREARLSTMDDGQRKKYEEQLAAEQVQSMQSRLAELESQVNESNAVLNAQTFFLGKGVPADKLILNQGYDALVNSGWEFVESELTRLRSGKTEAVEKKQRKEAPTVITDKAPPSKGTTWKELREKYGSEEAVYQAVENGTLDPSIIPA